jgi:hypothetical protein
MVELRGPSGPLDLLLHLLREKSRDRGHSGARIADRFLLVIHDLG